MLARRLFERGHELWVTPDSVVVHEAHSSARQLGGALRRQYLASIVRMLEDTESPLKVWTYRAVVFSQNLVLWLSGRSRVPSRSRPLAHACRGPRPSPHPSLSARLGGYRSRRLTGGERASTSEPLAD